MKKLNKILSIVLALTLIAALLAGCGPKIPTGDTGNDTSKDTSKPADSSNPGDDTTEDTSGTPAVTPAIDMYPHDGSVTLRMDVGYNNEQTGIFFHAKTIGDGGTITLPDGNTYRAGDLKPTWVELSNVLGVKFEDRWQGQGGDKEWEYYESQLDQVDMITANASTIKEQGIAGALVNLADYMDYMPNFKAYLDANPIVKLSITADVEEGDFQGAIFFSPYFDGVDDIERMFLMRYDWVEKLLNTDEDLADSKPVKTGVYQPYMPTSGKLTIDTVSADGSSVVQVTKDYDAYGNIVEKMNAAGSIDGNTAVKMLREYIDKTYGGFYTPDHRADLFIGQNSCWDADELVALLRCVVSNPKTLNGTDTIQGIFCREDNNLGRQVDTIKMAGHLFGVRGVESRNGGMWIDSDGTLHDYRMEVDTYEALGRMHDMAEEGLISQSYINGSEENTKSMLQNDLGFMHYDYNQTQTGSNQYLQTDEGERYSPVINPVARWYDGTDPNGVYMRFTESWRSVKGSNCWGIVKAGIGDDMNKLYACLALIDYAYSREGTILMSYGPDAFLKHDASGNVVTFDFNGEQWPEISDEVEADVWDPNRGGGSYTNYARYYLGSTLSFKKSQAFEFECTHEIGQIGGQMISRAIALGVLKHPFLSINTDNMWYTSLLTTLPLEKTESDQINSYAELATRFATDTKKGDNIMVNIIQKGFTEEGLRDPQSTADTVANTWKCKAALSINAGALERAIEYYNNYLA